MSLRRSQPEGIRPPSVGQRYRALPSSHWRIPRGLKPESLSRISGLPNQAVPLTSRLDTGHASSRTPRPLRSRPADLSVLIRPQCQTICFCWKRIRSLFAGWRRAITPRAETPFPTRMIREHDLRMACCGVTTDAPRNKWESM